MECGKIILLNGTSSSGKSRTADALWEITEEPFFRFSSDFVTIPPRFSKEPYIIPLLDTLLHGHYHCMREMAITGNNLIVDVVIEDQVLLEECIKSLYDQMVYFVGVHCPLEELERRERERGDRSVGMAKDQFEKVHVHGIYDIEINTDEMSPLQCAEKIEDFVKSNQTPTALQRSK